MSRASASSPSRRFRQPVFHNGPGGGGGGGGSRRFFHYNPDPYQKPRKPWLKTLRDMALGSALTILLSFAYDYYEERQYIKEFFEEQSRIEDVRLQLSDEFARARSEPDEFDREAKLRDITFKIPTLVTDVPEDMGWLPGFPVGDELYAKERVPVSETKMYAVSHVEGGFSGLIIAANVDVEDPPGPPYFRPVPREEYNDAAGCVIGELVARARIQKDLWRKQGKLPRHDDDFIAVFLYIRNHSWIFALDGDVVRPDHGLHNILKHEPPQAY